MSEISGQALSEPLERLARYAFDWAEDLCEAEHNCASYHKMWSLVRLLEANGELPSGEDFFDQELPKVARNGLAKVLLSGAADTGLMTLAASALMKASIEPEIVMVDRCATPLEQARLFALANNLNFRTMKGTLDQVDVEEADAILAHSFLTFFAPGDRPALFAAWFRALRPGGKVMMSQRLTPDGESYTRQRPPSQIAARRAKLAAVLEHTNPVNAECEPLLDAAEALWTNALGGNSVSAEEISKLCAQSGLHVESIRYDRGDQSVSPFAIPEQAIKRPRAEIVLRR